MSKVFCITRVRFLPVMRSIVCLIVGYVFANRVRTRGRLKRAPPNSNSAKAAYPLPNSVELHLAVKRYPVCT
jgi:hypothetical protein